MSWERESFSFSGSYLNNSATQNYSVSTILFKYKVLEIPQDINLVTPQKELFSFRSLTETTIKERKQGLVIQLITVYFPHFLDLLKDEIYIRENYSWHMYC